ncbi:MAG TPA: phosphatase PAP2 family protein [Actinomycetota bacterium]|nr:phosphatase PAP2 family protein [Actinomycetota bacterium]
MRTPARVPKPVKARRERLEPDALLRIDLALFRRLARWRAPFLDRTLPPLTRFANKSKLWALIAVLMGLSGGRFGRRGALRGMVSVAATSAVANIPGKLLTRRKRPDPKLTPVVRRLARMPTSSSFPSGHSASAFAFATGVAMERPMLAPPLIALAATIGFSRVYTGAHYPSDVVAGAALGAGIALASRRYWPVAPDEPAEVRAALTRSHQQPLPDGTGLAIAVNPSSGPAVGRSPAQELREALPGADVIELEEGMDLEKVLEAAAGTARALGVAGGDGSVNTAAAVAHRHGMPLLVVPSGTLNHFARDLGVAGVADAVRAVKEGSTAAVDVASIHGHGFLNTASFGAYVELVDARERLESRIGKWPAVLVALVRVMREAEPLDLEIDGKPARVWMAFIGNCRYHPRGFTPSWRERLDDGQLDVRIVSASQAWSRAKLVWSIVTGRLASCPAYECSLAERIEVRSMQGPLRLARDGETFDGSNRFVIEKLPKPLAVFTPSD